MPASSPLPRTPGDIARGVAAVLALITCMLGLPAAMICFGSNPLAVRFPHHWPTFHAVWDRLWTPDYNFTLLNITAQVVIWVCWAIFTYLVIAEFVEQLRYHGRYTPPPDALRRGIAGLVAAVILLLSTHSATTPHAPAMQSVVSVQEDPRQHQLPVHLLAQATTAQHPVVSEAAVAPAEHPQLPRYTVRHLDTLWGIAQKHLGSGLRYQEIYDLNRDHLPDPHDLHPGDVLLLPADATDLPQPPADPGPGAHQITVRPGETLTDIAARELGDPHAWTRLFDINRDRPQPDGRVLADPDRLHPGWRLWIPATTPTPPPATPLPATPQQLAQPPATSSPARPPHTPPPAVPGAAPATRAPALAAPAPAPAMSSPPTSTGHTPSPATPDTPTHGTSAGKAPEHRDPSATHTTRTPQVVVLPSGSSVSLGFAAAIATAVVVMRLRRRHRRRITGTLTPLPPPPELPPTVARLDRAARHANTHDNDNAQQARPLSRRWPWPPPAPTITGYTPSGQQRSLDVTGVAGLGLTGPGGPAAARAALTAILAADALYPAQLHITDPAASALLTATDSSPLAQDSTEDTHIHGVIRHANLGEALRALETALATRMRMTADHTLRHDLNPIDHAAPQPDTHDTNNEATQETTEFHAYRTNDPGEALPTLLLCATVEEAHNQRLAAVLNLARSYGIAGLLLGNWPTSIDIAEDGTVISTHSDLAAMLDATRLHTLTTAETREVLTVLSASRGGPDPTQAPHTTNESEVAIELVDTEPFVAHRDSGDAGSLHDHEHLSADASPVQTRNGQYPDSQPQAKPVMVSLFGRVRIHADGNDVTAAMRNLSKDLIAYLALHGEASTETLHDQLLPDEQDPARASRSIHNAVYYVRAPLRAALGDIGADAITTSSGRYRLNPDILDVDTWQLGAAIAAARTAPDTPTRIQALTRVAEICRTGPPLDDATLPWAETAREHLRSQSLNALARLVTLIRDDDPDQALDVLTIAITLDPYAEPLYRQAIQLHAQLDRPEPAYALYRLLRARLADIDVDPDPATEAALPLPSRRRP